MDSNSMKWIIITSCLYSLSLLVVGRAVRAKQQVDHYSSQGEVNYKSFYYTECDNELYCYILILCITTCTQLSFSHCMIHCTYTAFNFSV